MFEHVGDEVRDEREIDSREAEKRRGHPPDKRVYKKDSPIFQLPNLS